MKCPSCGAAVEEGADLCLECGEPMGDAPAAKAARAENVIRPPADTFAAPKPIGRVAPKPTPPPLTRPAGAAPPLPRPTPPPSTRPAGAPPLPLPAGAPPPPSPTLPAKPAAKRNGPRKSPSRCAARGAA